MSVFWIKRFLVLPLIVFSVSCQSAQERSDSNVRPSDTRSMGDSSGVSSDEKSEDRSELDRYVNEPKERAGEVQDAVESQQQVTAEGLYDEEGEEEGD